MPVSVKIITVVTVGQMSGNTIFVISFHGPQPSSFADSSISSGSLDIAPLNSKTLVVKPVQI